MKTLKASLSHVLDTARRFDQDEDGIESIQVVMILAFAAVVMVVAWAFWGQINSWAGKLIKTFLKSK
jgi:Flp pilus assembly pilin Flp